MIIKVVKNDLRLNGIDEIVYEISINDATLIQKGIAGSVEFTTEQKAVADANGDGEVNISDVTVIQKFAAGLIETI